MSDPADPRSVGRERRRRRRTRKALTSVAILTALIASITTDSAFGWPSDGGSGPLVLIAAAITVFAQRWNDARVRDGIERVVIGRAAILAIGLVTIYAVATYVAWLVNRDLEPRPGTALMVVALSMMVGNMFADVGLMDEPDE